MKATFWLITFTDMALTYGLIREPIKGIGNLIKCMEEVFSLGVMVESMKVNTMMIRSMVKVYLRGQTERNTKAIGKTGSSMA